MANGYDISHVSRMKFLRPLQPGLAFDIEVTPRNDHAVISWLAGETTVATARVVLRAHVD